MASTRSRPAISPAGCAARPCSSRKTFPYEEAPADAVPAATEQPLASVPVEQTATDGTAPPDAAAPADTAIVADPAVDRPGDAAADPALAADPAAQAPVTDPAAAPAASATDATSIAADPAVAATAPAEASAAAPPADAAATEPTIETPPAATPVPVADASVAPAEGAVEAAPAPEADVTPVPQPEMNPTGPASVIVDAPIRVGPAASYDLIFTVPNGSTVEQTGHVVDGYVTVQYKEVTGWLALEHLGPAERLRRRAAAAKRSMEPVEHARRRAPVRAWRTPPSISACATGPSATAEPITVVPAGIPRRPDRGHGGWLPAGHLPRADRLGRRTSTLRTRQPRRRTPAASEQRTTHAGRSCASSTPPPTSYDQSRSDMLRVAECESNLDPYAVNPSGSYGLFQFIRSTWKSTPFGDKDIFDPEANANAAAWMWSEGRKSEWVCQ